MRFGRLFFLSLLFSQCVLGQTLSRYVDPFIGTAGHGHTFPGATLPFGMVQLSPDTRLSGWDGCSGYHYSDRIIYGFSHTHLSGTGISDYGDILLMPTVGEVYLNAMNGDQTDKGYASRFDHKNERAQPGYYSVKLDDEDIFVELTTTKRVGFHRYHFPKTQRANVILDLQHRDKVLDSALRIVDSTHIEGFRRSEAWAKDQVVYFVAEFSKPMTLSGISNDASTLQRLSEARSNNLRAIFQFDTTDGTPLQVKVAISSVSIEGARKNLAAELNHWDFERVRSDATQAWNVELRKIEVSGGTEAQLRNFYTALYHAMIAPNLFMDADGQYLGRDFKIHTAKGFENHTVFSLWDTFRAAHPLYTIIDQKRTVDFVRTFLAQYEQGGRLPVWEFAANETDTMIGYHAVPVIADAVVKGIAGFDREQALTAMKHSANLKHFGLAAYTHHGFINMEEEREAVSKTLEYAYDDWCIAETARILGRKDDYRRFVERAQYYKNVFDPESGFMRPRTNGGWLAPFDPREVDFNFTEANSWQYSFFVPQDINGLIDLMGGKERFARKLDELFGSESKTTGREQADITGLIGQYAHGNEPSHHMAYLYNYVNRPWKTQQRVRQIMDTFYRPDPDGLIGNEDCGQLSAWFVLSAAGFYPVTPASPVYVIGTPLFPELRLNLENGKSFVVKAHGVSEKNIYIQSARLNRKRYNKSYLTHGDLMAGGELVFQMGPEPNLRWGAGDKDVPVSRIVDHQIVSVPVIIANGKTFRDRLNIAMHGVFAREGRYVYSNETPSNPQNSFRSGSTGANIHYTTDGSEPTSRSQRYVQPFFIDSSLTLKAVAITDDGRRSLVNTANYHRIPHNWTITLISKYSSQYTGGGDLALIDGIRGTTNWSGGGWQGYWGQDFVAVIDLGKVQEVTKLGAGFLQDVGSWILMPRQVEFEVSLDGREFVRVASITNDVPEKQYGVIIKDFAQMVPTQRPANPENVSNQTPLTTQRPANPENVSNPQSPLTTQTGSNTRMSVQPLKARYIRIRAQNFGKLPAWHPGVGGNAWIFVDEIIVQ